MLLIKKIIEILKNNRSFKPQKETEVRDFFTIDNEEQMKHELYKIRKEEFLQGSFTLKSHKIVFTYLQGLLEGDPIEAMYAEVIRPISKLPLLSDGFIDYGLQYILPDIFEGELKLYNINRIPRLPEYCYKIELLSNLKTLTLIFWSHHIMSEQEIQEVVNKKANFNLAKEVISDIC